MIVSIDRNHPYTIDLKDNKQFQTNQINQDNIRVNIKAFVVKYGSTPAYRNISMGDMDVVGKAVPRSSQKLSRRSRFAIPEFGEVFSMDAKPLGNLGSRSVKAAKQLEFICAVILSPLNTLIAFLCCFCGFFLAIANRQWQLSAVLLIASFGMGGTALLSQISRNWDKTNL
jgi:hypothetical protein